MTIQLIDQIEALRAQVRAWRHQGDRVGFVPTMGALHAGHVSLVQAARRTCDRVVASVFVNPTQFGPGEDLARYPRDLEGDARQLEAGGCDVLFTTTPEVMYPPGFATWVTVEGLTDGLCGAFRPGHFRGVTTVVAKLFAIVLPDEAFFGQKDRQQLEVIRRMTADLNLPVRVMGCPIVREPDGLAMSSRNAYLSPAERERALALIRGLRRAEAAFRQGERDGRTLEALCREEVAAGADRIDYVQAVDPGTLRPVEEAAPGTILLVAAHLGKTRLIDNLELTA